MNFALPAENHETTFRDLYPTLSEQELKKAEANFARYFEIAWEICRERNAPKSAIDSTDATLIMNGERSNSSYKN